MAQNRPPSAPPLPPAGPAPTRPAPGAGLSPRMVMLFAVACGMAVANIYYIHPLLTGIAGTFNVSSGTTSVVVTVQQVAYVAGLALLVPLGDVRDRRRLAVTLLTLAALAEVVMAAAPTVQVLAAATALLALCTVVAPILVPFAATLAAPEERGRVSGKVISGLLMGVLLARTGGGLVAQWGGGWRTVFAVAAAMMLLLALTLRRALPHLPPAAQLTYPALLRSVGSILREEPALQLRCAYGILSFAGFNALWTSIAFLLAGPPYSYSEGVIGLFGLAGVAGAYAARVAGPLADRGKDYPATGALFAAILLGWVLMAVNGGHWLAPLLLGVLVLDFGVQGLQVTNLSVIYRRRPEARSRMTTAYMTIYFLGGALGSAVSGAAYQARGWVAVCLAGMGFAALALAMWAAEGALRRRARARRPAPGE